MTAEDNSNTLILAPEIEQMMSGWDAHRNEIFDKVWVREKTFRSPAGKVLDTMFRYDTLKILALETTKRVNPSPRDIADALVRFGVGTDRVANCGGGAVSVRLGRLDMRIEPRKGRYDGTRVFLSGDAHELRIVN